MAEFLKMCFNFIEILRLGAGVGVKKATPAKHIRSNASGSHIKLFLSKKEYAF